MERYKEVEGNLLDMFDNGNFNIIAHGANCMNYMGAGIASQIKQRYPEVYYADYYDARSAIQKFGSFSSNMDENIFNLYTQYAPGPNANLTAVRMSLKQLSLYLPKIPFKIGLPLIGCGIGGLDWKDVRPIIQDELRDFDVTVVHFK